MRSSSANKAGANAPVQLVKPWTLALIAVAIGGLLVLTYTGEDMLLPENREPDAVSANYAELLLEASPQDDELRLELIELLIRLGDHARADRHLRAWPNPDPVQAGYYRLKIDVTAALASGNPEELDQTRQQLMRYDVANLEADRREHLAELALRLELPGFAAERYEELAELVPARREQYLNEAARWYLAGNRADRAAAVYLTLLPQHTDSESRPAAVRRAYEALLAAGQPQRASELLVQEMVTLPVNQALSVWLRQGVTVAMGAQRFDLADAIVRHWRSVLPDSETALESDFRLRLAAGEVGAAWEPGQRLVERRPDDAALLKQMASLAEWNGFAGQALELWAAYLNEQADPRARDRAWRLAFQLYDYQQAIAWLNETAAERRLSDAELDALTFAHEARGTPDQSERWLRGYIRKEPSHRLAWMRLSQNLENTQQLQAKADLLAEASRRFDLTVAERLDWASVLWRLYRPEAAWEILHVEDQRVTDAEYWRTRAALAWELERDEDMRLAYESLQRSGTALTYLEEGELIDSYAIDQPNKALELLIASWRDRQDVARLIRALQLADQLGDLQVYRELVREAELNPNVAEVAQMLAARGTLAQREGRFEEAERLYRLGVERFPREYQFHERLLWRLIDQQRVSELPMLLTQWRDIARQVGALWLPYATANQLLQRNEQALAWFRLYLQANADDWLALAAYADALDAAGRVDQAYRLRQTLLARFEGRPFEATPQRYATWLRLLSASVSSLAAERVALQWRDGSPALLQVWFDRLLSQLDVTNQEAQKDQWLAWGRSQGLQVDRYNLVQEALRQNSRDELERFLDSSALDPAQRVAVLERLGRSNTALSTALSNLGGRQPAVIVEQLRRQAVSLHERHPQGIRAGWQRQDFGGFDRSGFGITTARHLNDDWYAALEAEQSRYDSDLIDARLLGEERRVQASLERELAEGSVLLTVDASQHRTDDRIGLGFDRAWRLGSRDELTLSLDWDATSSESGLIRALGKQSGVAVLGRHAISARDQFSWNLRHNRFDTRAGDSLGEAEAISAEWTQVQQFAGPTWIARTGFDYQRARLDDDALSALTFEQGGPVRLGQLDAGSFLQEEFGRVYAGMSWQRGVPGALNRTRAQYTWLVDTLAGWQWTDRSFVYGINAGVGVELIGDDELALTAGYQSAPRGGAGEPGGTVGLTYSLRFGR